MGGVSAAQASGFGQPTGTRPLADLRSSGLLWLINRTVFHPRGVALALVADGDGQVVGWQLLGDGTEPIWFPPDDEAGLFALATATLAEQLVGPEQR